MSKTTVIETVSDTVITEFRGTSPVVPPRAGIDMEMLTKGDDDPFFITVEISSEGRVSKNGLLHDAELAETLVSQINSQAAEGIMGHIKKDERSTAYPVSDVHWLGAARHGNKTWAKGYIPRTAAAKREHFRILKATNGRAATSIFGGATQEFVDKSRGVWRAKDFRLEQLDLAPFTRAALAPESDFVITSEMETPMDRNQLISELTVDDIPARVRDALVAEYRTQVSDRDTLIAELQTSVAEFRRREFDLAVDARVAELTAWQVTGDEAKKKLDSFRRTLKSRIVSELGEQRDAAKIATVVETIWADLQPLAETVRDALAGPPAIVAGKVVTKREKFEDTPEARAKARAVMGI